MWAAMKKREELRRCFNMRAYPEFIYKSSHESTSRPPCGFWRIDDQQLDIYLLLRVL
jgi:hypothetical protein